MKLRSYFLLLTNTKRKRKLCSLVFGAESNHKLWEKCWVFLPCYSILKLQLYFICLYLLLKKDQRTVNKLMVVSPLSVVKLLQTCFSLLCWRVPLHKCNITYCKYTSWLYIRKQLLLRSCSQWYCTWPGVDLLPSKNLKWSTLLLYNVFFATLNHFIFTVIVVPRDPEFFIWMPTKLFLFSLKNQCVHNFSVLAPDNGNSHTKISSDVKY